MKNRIHNIKGFIDQKFVQLVLTLWRFTTTGRWHWVRIQVTEPDDIVCTPRVDIWL